MFLRRVLPYAVVLLSCTLFLILSCGDDDKVIGPDTSAPAAITDLAVTDSTAISVTLSWTAPGDDGGSGTAAAYDIRHHDSPITEANWGDATQCSDPPKPSPAGTEESFVVPDLTPGATHHFAIRARDEAGNLSGLSNSSSGTTTDLFAVPLFLDAGSGPDVIVSADFDGDQDIDIVTASRESRNVSLLENAGDGVFLDAVTVFTGARTIDLLSADFDGDGDLDVAVAQIDMDVESANGVWVLRNSGDASFVESGFHRTYAYPTAMAAADLNEDGMIDLAVAGWSLGQIEQDSVSILLNRGDGTFHEANNVWSGGAYPMSLASTDIGGDASTDLAVALSQSDAVAVLEGDGTGAFANARIYSGVAWPTTVCCADFNGDALNDIAVANTGNSEIYLMENRGSDLTITWYFQDGWMGRGTLGCSDLDMDGDLDLVSSNFMKDSVDVLLNVGDATFTRVHSMEVYGNPSCLSLADYDCDGDTDVAFACPSAEVVTILLNQCVD